MRKDTESSANSASLFFGSAIIIVMLVISSVTSAGIIQISETDGKLSGFRPMSARANISKAAATETRSTTMLQDYHRKILSEPNPIPFVLSQPDGSTFQARIVGDKFGGHLETLDGFTIMQDNLGRWTYAKEDNGKIVHSEFIVGSTTGSKLSGIKKHLIPNDRELLTRSLPQLKKAAGTGKIIAIMLQFTNVQFTPAHTKEYYSNMLFSTTDNSMNKFYIENSYNTYSITGDVVGPFTSAHTMEYYGDDSIDWQSPDDANGPIYEMAREAVQLADATVDFSGYDTDGDGYVDNLIVIHAGPDQTAGGGIYGSDAIWSHQWYIYPAPGELVDGVRAFRYATDPEEGQIGVFCHEYGHQLGLPDLYDVDYSSMGIGDWSLMASGSWLGGGIDTDGDGSIDEDPADGVDNDGDGKIDEDTARDQTNPAHLDAWCKEMLEWISTVELTSNTTSVGVNAVESNSQAYKIMINTPNEYFLIENRNKNAGNYDKYLPGEGLLIYHIDDNQQNNNNENHKLVDVEEAHSSTQNLDYPSGNTNSNKGDANDPWKNSVSGFSDFSDPNAMAYGKTRTGTAIKNIGSPGTAMNFDFNVVFPTQVAQEVIIYCKDKSPEFGSELRTISPNGADDTLLFDGVIPEGYLIPMWPRYSIDGEEIVFSALKGEYWQIWTMDSDAKNLFRVFNASAYGTFPGASVYSPSFSYDKQKVAFVFDPVDSDAFLVVSYSNGSDFWRISEGGQWCVYSPMDYRIAAEGATVYPAGTGVYLSVGDTEGTSWSLLLPPGDGYPYWYEYIRPLDWSPDGTKLLCRDWWWPVGVSAASGYYALWIVDINNPSNPSPVFGYNSADGYTNENNVILQASFSSDGTKVVFDLSDGLDASGVAGKDFDIYTINVDGTGLSKITNDKKSGMPNWCKQPFIPKPGNIAGYAYHKDLNNPVVGATVTLTPGGYTTTTDSIGYYSVVNVPAGRYTVTISKSGYSSKSSVLAVAGTSVASSMLYLNVTNPGTVNGSVYIAGTSTPVANAIVATTRGDYNTTTSSSGAFTISNIAPNPYNVTATAQGYRYSSTSVAVTAGGIASCNISLAPLQTANWTYIVYLDGDNNLCDAGDSDYQEMQSVGSTDSVNIVVLKDNEGFGDTKLLVPNIGSATSTEIPLRHINASFGIELDMGSYLTLSNFVLWAIEKYPAQHYAVDLWDHGGGYIGMCWDDISGTHISIPDLKCAMIAITNELGRPIDVLVHDSCLMAEVEADYDVKAYADFIVHSEETVPGDGIPYHSQYGGDILGRLKSNPQWLPEEFAIDIVSEYGKRYAAGNPQSDGKQTYSAVNTTRLDDGLALAVNNFAQKLKHVASTYYTEINNSMQQAETYEYQELIDLYDFASRVKASITDATTQQAAQFVIDNISNCVIAEWHGNNHFNSHGLSIFFPWSYNAYTQRVSDYSPLYMAIESKWNDFLQAFYNKQDYANTEPVCSIAMPSNNEIVCQGAVITISGTASDTDGISEVQIKIDRGDWIDAGGTTAWSYNWSATGIVEGYHRIYARALDNKALDIAKDYSWYQCVAVNVIKNLPPVITSFNPALNPTINETEPITFNITANDPEGKQLTYQWYKIGTLIAGETTASYTFSTDYDSSGIYNITVVISDDYVSISYTWILEVRNKNRKPVLNEIGERIAYEGQAFTLQVSASDPDYDNLTYYDNTTLFEISLTTGLISFTPDYESNGTYWVNITVSDGAYIDYKIFKLIIVNVNRAPVISSASPEPEPVNEGQSITFNISAYDPDGTVPIITWKLDWITVYTGSSYTFVANYTSSGIHVINVSVSDGEAAVYYQWTLTVIELPPTAVVLNEPTTMTTTTITITWSECKEGDFVNYTIYLSTSQGAIGNPTHMILSSATTYYTITGLMPNTTYYVIVRAYDSSNLYNNSNQVSGKTLVVNHPPQITSFSPLTDMTIKEGEVITFNVTAFDPDGTAPTIEWRLNSVSVVTGISYTFTANYTSSGTYTVNATITDGEYSIYHQWTLTVADVTIITPAGGNILFETIVLDIPLNAVSTNTTITITPISITPPSYCGAIGGAYKIEATIAAFTVPITITLSYSNVTLPEGISEDDLAIWVREDGSWEMLGGIVNKINKTVSAQVTSLSEFAIFYEIKKGEPQAEISWALIGGTIGAIIIILLAIIVIKSRGRSMKQRGGRRDAPMAYAPYTPVPYTPIPNTKFCIFCGVKIPRSARVCPECGTRQE